MLKLFILIVLISIFSLATGNCQSINHSNSGSVTNNSYQLTAKIEVFKFKYDPSIIQYTASDIDLSNGKWVNYGWRFDVIDTLSINFGKSYSTTKKFYIIKFWGGLKAPNANKIKNKKDEKPTESDKISNNQSDESKKLNYKDNESYFCIEEAIFKNVTESITPKSISWFVATTTTIPFEARTGGQTKFLDFSPSATLGFIGGIKQKLSYTQPSFLDYFIFGGVSSILVDSTTTTSNGITKYKGSQQTPAFTTGIGIAKEFQGGQIGLFIGVDFAGPNFNDKWIYEGHPWLGISIGASIFSTAGNDNKDNAASSK